MIDRREGGITMPDGRRIWLREWAFVAPSQIGRPPTGKTGGPWEPLVASPEKLLREVRKFRKRTRQQSRWYRRNQHAIQRLRRSDPKFGLGKNADWARLYPHGRHRILASRDVW